MRGGAWLVWIPVLPAVACASLAPDVDAGIDSGATQDGGGAYVDASDGGCARRLFYEDLDGDRYGNPLVSEASCVQPEGYVSVAGDCDDRCAGCNPGATEICEGRQDENCDGSVDEGCPCSGTDTRPCGLSEGLCEPGRQSCVDGAWSECGGGVGPTEEICDGLDQDCSGVPDDAFADLGMPCQVGEGACLREGILQCRADGTGTRCSATAASPAPEELCGNDVDDDCDGLTDEAPGGGCCDDTHCGASERCSMGSCIALTHCDGRARPSGVAVSDYACLDFDGSPDLPGAPWTASVQSDGELSVTESQWFSAPRALRARVYAEDSIGGDEAVLEWETSGATPVASALVTLNVRLDGLSAAASETGRVELLCVENGSSKACLAVSTQYGQFAVLVRDVVGPQQQLCGHVEGDPFLAENVWNELAMTFDTSDGLAIAVDGTPVPLAGCSYVLENDTDLRVRVGANTSPTTSFARTILFDNVEVTVRR